MVNLDGSNRTVVAEHDMGSPIDVEVDSSAGYVYSVFIRLRCVSCSKNISQWYKYIVIFILLIKTLEKLIIIPDKNTYPVAHKDVYNYILNSLYSAVLILLLCSWDINQHSKNDAL